METNTPGDVGPSGVLDRRADSRDAVTGVYQAHAVGLIRLAVVMLGDRPVAEEVVQEAFCGLYQHWDRLADPGKALGYVRSAVLNGCRSALRRRARWQRGPLAGPLPRETAESAESSVLASEEHRAVLAALRRLPSRQREAPASTGHVLRVVNHILLHRNYEQVYWANPSGRSVLVTGTQPAGRSPGSFYLASPGVLTGGHFRPIPWPGQNFAAAW